MIEKGISKHFLPVLVDKADELTQRADKAILEGRWFQAGDLYRQARWQLPYQSSQVPAEHVVRVLGNLRTRHDAAVNAIAFSPDGKLLASAGDDFVVRIWDLANGREVRALTGHGKEVFAVAFSPDGKVLASGAGEPNIRLWNVADGKELRDPLQRRRGFRHRPRLQSRRQVSDRRTIPQDPTTSSGRSASTTPASTKPASTQLASTTPR